MRTRLHVKLLALVLLISTHLYGATGTLSVYTFQSGMPLSGAEVTVAGNNYATDADGKVKMTLEVGLQKIEIFAKDSNGNNLGYAKKSVTIIEGKDTEIIAEFNNAQDQNILVDTPLESAPEQKMDMSRLGTLEGTVLTSDKNRPISNARVFVKGTSIDTRTDENGKFSVEIPADTKVSISVVHSEYSSQTLNDLEVAQNATIKQEIKLTPASMELEEFVVLAPKVKGSIASIMAEEKEAKSISNILGSEEMSKKGDSDAASALKRVTGVTLIGGKSIFVRGLGERYSNIEMNSMPLPSPNPMKRVVPLDIFPSGVISSLKVQKSGTADIPAAFGGGYVDIRTKDKANEDYVTLSLGIKGNTDTGNSVYTYKGSDTDWLGVDDGYREISSQIVNSQNIALGEPLVLIPNGDISDEELTALTKEHVKRNFNVNEEDLPLGGSFGVEVAKNFDLDNGHKVFIFGNYKYEQDHDYREEEYFSYDMDFTTGELKPFANQYGDIYYTKSDYMHSFIFNLGYSYYDAFKIKYTKLYTKNSSKITKVSDGILGSNDEDLSYYFLDWEERDMDVDQISGDMDYSVFDMDSTFTFGTEMATAKLYQPNNYLYIFFNEDPFRLKMNTTNSLANNLSSDDDLFAFYLKNKMQIPMTSDNDFVEFGYSNSAKTRESRYNKFSLQGNASQNLTGDTIESIYDEYVRNSDDPEILLQSLFQSSNYYDAEIDNSALFFNAFVNPFEEIEILLGARSVSFKQTTYIWAKDSANPDMNERRNLARFKNSMSVDKILPSMGVKYKYDPSNYFDFAVSQTYIAPDIREFTDGVFYHPYDVATIIGNPNLKNTDITSYDLKYSHFFSDTESVKVGLFYKDLKNPIEDAMQPSTSLPVYTYINSDHATLYGFELDGRKNLDFISNEISDFFVSGNFSYSDSDVTLTAEQESIYSTNHRQLQGLSQTVINLSLGYDIKGRSIVASYNKMGERIRKVGLIYENQRYPDHIEDPAALLDLVWIEKLNSGFAFNVKLGNLLDEETVWKQGDRVSRRYKDGRTFSASMSYKF